MPKPNPSPEQSAYGYKEALRRIEKCEREKSISLNLRMLDLAEVPPQIGQLTNLTTLYLTDNQLTTLPRQIGKLTHLTSLCILINQLTMLPPQIGRLTNLAVLALAGNELTTLPPQIGQLTNLWSLDLRSNQLTTLPPQIGQLTNLTELDLAGNQLTMLPAQIGRLINLRELFLHENPGLGIPDSILGPTYDEVYGPGETERKPARPADILNFYFRGRSGSLREVGEVKMMLVGRGGAGKTSLRRFFLGQPHDAKEPETPGIALDMVSLPCGGGKAKVRLWDFAGQEITHALHQFFLTEGCVYLLVLDPRSNTEMRDAEYWLELLRRYAGGTPVVVALNRQDGRQGGYDVDRRALQERFPFVRQFVPTNCDTRAGCEGLRSAVCAVIDGLSDTEPPCLKVPEAWLAVMRECRGDDRAQERQHLTLEEFRAICARNGEHDPAKQESLARLLHRLGAVLHFVDEPRLRDTSVLNPHWVTDATYRLLRFKDRPESDGTLTLDEALAALPDETEKTVRFLLRLMERFEMCFPIDEDGEKLPNKWLIPGALDPFQPAGIGPEWQEAGSVRMRYSYDPLPEGVLPRFIVLTHSLSEGRPRWRNGVLLAEGHAKALVRRGEKPNHVEVTAFGPDADRLRLLEIIQGNLERINADVPAPRPYAEMELAGLPGIYRSVADLEAAERARQAVIISGPPEARVEPTPQLNQTSDEASRDLSKIPLRAFLSYSHEDKRAKNVLQNNLMVMMKKRFINSWHDGLIEPGMRWREEIEENLEKMDVFIGLLTTAFLASDFIERVEIKAARNRLREKGRDFVFVLILVDDISLGDLDLAEYQILKPGGRCISQHANRKAGFDAAQKELEKLFAKRQKAKKQERKSEQGEFRLERASLRQESTHEGVTFIVKGDYIAGNKPTSMTDDHRINIGGDNYGQAGQTLTNCTNLIQQQAPGERKELLQKIESEVKALIASLPEEKQEEAAGDLEQLVKGATAATPNRRWYSVSAEGLLEASKFVQDFTGNIAGTIGQLGKMLWPDFEL